jgi:putative peptidoglycan lipid II flippase
VLVNAFYAVDKRKTPMMISFMAIGTNLLLNWLFTFHLGWGHRGLAFSTGCVASINFVILYVLMHRHLKHLETTAMLQLVMKTLLAGAVMAAICWSGQRWLLSDWASMHFLPKVAALLATIIVAGGAFFGCALLLRIPELDSLMAAVRRRLARKRNG